MFPSQTWSTYSTCMVQWHWSCDLLLERLSKLKDLDWAVPSHYLAASSDDIETGTVFANRLSHRERKHRGLRRVASVI